MTKLSIYPQVHESRTGSGTYDKAIKRRTQPPTTQDLSPSETLQNLESVGRTNVGRKRNHNEDFFSIDQQYLVLPSHPQGNHRGLYILCDGMGGMDKGEVASQLATKTLRDYLNSHWHHHLPTEICLELAVNAANKAVFEANLAERRSGLSRMGTTAVVVLVHNCHVRYVHLGDSRLYRLTRTYGLQKLTEDHNAYQRALRGGYSAEVAQSYGKQLTKALGPWSGESLHPNAQTFSVIEDTVLLLCSDGMSDYDLLEHHVDSHLVDLLDPRTDLTRAMDQLLALANQENGHDNITAIAVRLQP